MFERTSSQKVVIPKGMLNPNEIAVIEIPAELQSVETVVIKPKFSSNPSIGPERTVRLSKRRTRNLSAPLLCREFDNRQEVGSQNVISYRGFIPSKHRDNVIEEEFLDDIDEEVVTVFHSIDGDGNDKYNQGNLTRIRDKNTFECDYINTDYISKGTILSDTEPSEQSENKVEIPQKIIKVTNYKDRQVKSTAKELDVLNINIKSEKNSERKPEEFVKSNIDYNSTLSNLGDVLDLVENFEYRKIHKDLKEFQNARRKLVMDTSNLSTATCFNLI